MQNIKGDKNIIIVENLVEINLKENYPEKEIYKLENS